MVKISTIIAWTLAIVHSFIDCKDETRLIFTRNSFILVPMVTLLTVERELRLTLVLVVTLLFLTKLDISKSHLATYS